MKLRQFTVILTAMTLSAVSTPTKETIKDNTRETAPTDQHIDDLMSRMTVEEKVGQMTQIDLNVIVAGGYGNTDGTIDQEQLELAVNTWKVGSILNVTNNAYDLETWHRIITTIQDAAMKNPNQIPVIYGVDAIHGASYVKNSTLFPHNIGLAATRNTGHAARSARITAMETRASGARWNFDPVLDVGRNAVWPRFEETFGEDPVIVAEMGSMFTKAYEGTDLKDITTVASTLKHYLGYSSPRSGWDRTPAYMPEIEWREYELEQFREGVKAGASSVMISSGELNGVPVHGSHYLLTEVLRGELGFEGVIVSDWEDVNRLYTRHQVASSLKDAIRMAVMAGIDVSMTPHDYYFAEYLAELYREDEAVAERVNESVRRILRLKFDVGLFDNPYPEAEAVQNFGKPEYSEAAYLAALESITLLKNEGKTLPLPKEGTILLAGPCANNITSLHGSWSYTWQGNNADHYPETTRTIKEALEARADAGRVISASVPDYENPANYDTDALRRHAGSAGHIVVCVGEEAYAESPGSIRDLALDSRQVDLVKAAIATGKPVTVVLVEGRPRLINAFAGEVDAIVMAYRPGSRGADAIADVLLGNYNPAGRLPFTYPRFANNLVLYDHKWTEANVEPEVGAFVNTGYDPQFPFGHGLSYTTFAYSDFRLDRDILRGDEVLTVTVKVKNTGDMAGDEIVELYSRHMTGRVVPPMRRLRKFMRVHLQPGEEKRVDFALTARDLAYTRYGDRPGEYVRDLGEGEIRLMIAGFGFELEEAPDLPPFQYRPYKHSKSFMYRP